MKHYKETQQSLGNHWISDKIVKDIEERRKYKNTKDHHGIQ